MTNERFEKVELSFNFFLKFDLFQTMEQMSEEARQFLQFFPVKEPRTEQVFIS